MRSVRGTPKAWANRHSKDAQRQTKQRERGFWKMPKGLYVCPRCELEGTFVIREALACPGCLTRMKFVRREKPKKKKRR